MMAWFTSIVLLAACFMCAFSQNKESYACITGETCVDDGNFTLAVVDGTNYCCNHGDALTTTIKDKNGISRTTFFLNTKRDDEGGPIEEQTVICTCNAIDPAALVEEINKKIQNATRTFWDDWCYWGGWWSCDWD